LTAQEHYFLQDLHLKSERTGVLLFVSAAEHYVEIIADKGINDIVARETWQKSSAFTNSDPHN